MAGIVTESIVLTIGWTCPTGGTGYCSHAYVAGGWSVALVAGAILFALGIVLIAVGGRRPPR
ncbi:MAG: hypothetical protein E6K10_07275 [Methanobacteriota archaeon]|nr:MAG: hypothetical protein E6K10_07275 [Euryarchaeota archaeon]